MDIREMQKIAHAVAWEHRGFCRWAEIEDLSQEALVGILRAQKSYDPQAGPFRPYARKAALRAVQSFVWGQAPVNVARAPGAVRAEHRDQHSMMEPTQESDLWRKRLYGRLLELFQMRGQPEMIQAILLEGRTAKEIGGNARKIYKDTARAKESIGCDRRVYDLWKDRV